MAFSDPISDGAGIYFAVAFLQINPYMKKLALLTGGALLMMLAFSSCKKDPLNNLTTDESRIYITNYDTAASFAAYKTFSITDSVDVIQNNQLAGRELGSFDTAVINAFSQQMQSRGYQVVSSESTPDLAVNISRVYNTQTGVLSYADYWDYYDDYWDPYYYGYPGYGFYNPYAIGVYTITTGALEIDLLDLKNAKANGNKLVVIWTGLARGEQVFQTGNVPAEISALFDQSPYLKN